MATRKQATRRRLHITHAQLIELLMTIDHATPVGIVTRTEPKMKKTGNDFYGRVVKITDANVFANCDYTKRVNKQRASEGKDTDFQAGQRAIDMQRVYVSGKPTPVLTKQKVDGSTGTYFECHFYGRLKNDTRYMLDGLTQITKDDIREFLYESSSAEGQGLDDEVIVRTYLTRNIVELRCNGTDYTVIH